MKFKERTGFNKFLLVIYVFITATFPMLIVGFSLLGDNSFHNSDFLAGWWRLTFVFISFPLYIAYSSLLAREGFPKKNKNAILQLLSIFIPLIIYAYNKPDNIIEYIELGGLPVYLALNLIFFIAIIAIPLSKTKELDIKTVLTLFILFLISIPFIFYPVGYVFAYDLYVSIENLQDYEGILKIVSSILLVAYFHIKPVKMYYKKQMEKNDDEQKTK